MSLFHALMYLQVQVATARTRSFRIVMASQLVRFTLRVKELRNLCMKDHDTTFYSGRSTLKKESLLDGGDMQVLLFLTNRHQKSYCQCRTKHRFKQ
ncbi:uncharacterized protein LOC142344269 isoform X3 [Convolutriloba macropyga]|uniref:uncharacterized protein LOC142344269 isoform X3 n=1 Tax=Convolutriloba macropyga TaxID=536237 RepID=UPI003F520E37